MNDEQINAIEQALAVLSGGESTLTLNDQRLLVRASQLPDRPGDGYKKCALIILRDAISRKGFFADVGTSSSVANPEREPGAKEQVRTHDSL